MSYLLELKRSANKAKQPATQKKKAASSRGAVPLVTRVVSDGVRVGLQVRHVKWLNPAWKEKGAWFNPSRMWVYGAGSHDLLETLEAMESESVPKALKYDKEVVASQVIAAVNNPNEDYFAQLLGLRLFPIVGGGLALASTYDKPTLAALAPFERQWDADNRLWLLKDAAIDKVLERLELIAGVKPCFVYVHDEELELEVIVESIDDPVKLELDFSLGEKSEDEVAFGVYKGRGVGDGPVQNSYTKRSDYSEAKLAHIAERYSLYDHQVEGVKFLVQRNSALMGDDMGMGKSRQSIVAADVVRNDKPVLIVTPATAKLNFANEVRLVLGEDTPLQVISTGSDQVDQSAQWVVVNFELIGAVINDVDRFGVMLVDEAHSCKSGETIRTMQIMKASVKIPSVYLITGTPLINREEEVYQLLRICGHPLGALNSATFNQRYSGSSELRAKLADVVADWAIRREKKDLKENLPDKVVREVEIEAPADLRLEHDALLADKSITNQLTKLGRMRMLSERMKIDFVVDKVTNGRPRDKFIVFTEFLETVSELESVMVQAGIKCETMIGHHKPTQRAEAVKRFENDKSIKVFITTTKVGGESINLVSANTVIFAGLPWSHAKRVQAEDRAWRIGQKRKVTVMIPWVRGTADSHQIKLIKHKANLSEEVMRKALAQYNGDEEALASAIDELAEAA